MSNAPHDSTRNAFKCKLSLDRRPRDLATTELRLPRHFHSALGRNATKDASVSAPRVTWKSESQRGWGRECADQDPHAGVGERDTQVVTAPCTAYLPRPPRQPSAANADKSRTDGQAGSAQERVGAARDGRGSSFDQADAARGRRRTSTGSSRRDGTSLLLPTHSLLRVAFRTFMSSATSTSARGGWPCTLSLSRPAERPPGRHGPDAPHHFPPHLARPSQPPTRSSSPPLTEQHQPGTVRGARTQRWTRPRPGRDTGK